MVSLFCLFPDPKQAQMARVLWTFATMDLKNYNDHGDYRPLDESRSQHELDSEEVDWVGVKKRGLNLPPLLN